ncbi:GRB10-interacting GYF protein 2 [Hondaea fermentalgiana]|uniref:GRB10-interacting GYF protein 2 n=1 Tax=Hondaea fermentalgiana TaxID=2315210 RepID=A0A2R5G8T3_9STRA|nr:GRB10-interacting GYF protein 2 [Hondaea fermentalgiana]|eukprot:GBG24893.1 GRB10-interacting GYF protein 2 [Hondaea fermentalgiana]
MKNGEDAGSASAAGVGTTRNKMKFKPGWSAGGASGGAASVGLVRSSSLSSGRALAAASSSHAGPGASLANNGGDASSSFGAGVPTPNDAVPAPSSAKPYASIGKHGNMPRPIKEEAAATRLARIGRVPTPGASATGGKLTEQANLYQQRSKSPRDPSVHGGVNRVKYSRDEMYLFNPTSAPRPAFPSYVPPALISDVPLMTAQSEPIDRDALTLKWQEETEKRNGSRNAVGLGGDRRTSIPAGVAGQGRGRRLPEGLGGVAGSGNVQEGPGGPAGRRGPHNPAYGNGGGSWRSGGAGGPGGGPPPRGAGAGEGGRFGNLGRGTGRDNWSGQERGSRWNDYPSGGNGSGPGGERDTRRSGEGGGRWDRLGPPSGRSFPDRGYGAGATNANAPAAGGTREDRWGRNANYREGGAFGPRGGMGQFSGQPQHDDNQIELVDDRGTFSEEAMSGSFGLESMAAAASKFHEEMQAARGGGDAASSSAAPAATASSAAPSTKAEGGDGNLEQASTGGFFSMPDSGMSGALEEGLEQPPAEEVAPASQAIDGSSLGFGGPGGFGAQSHLLQPQPSGWGQNPWLEAQHDPTGGVGSLSMQGHQSSQQPADLSGGQNRWIVPPAGGSGGSMPGMAMQPAPAPGMGMPTSMLAPPPALSNEWFYRDPQGNVQGPFKSEEMREWLQHGYFNPDLLVRRGHGNDPFAPLGQQFPDARKAFTAEGDAEVQMRMLQQQQQPGSFWQMGQNMPPLQQPHLGMQQAFGGPAPSSQNDDAQARLKQEQRQAEERARAEKEKAEWEARERERQERERQEREERERQEREREEEQKRKEQEDLERKRQEQEAAEAAARAKAEAERRVREEEEERQRKAQEEEEARKAAAAAAAAAAAEEEEARRQQQLLLQQQQEQQAALEAERLRKAQEEQARIEEERRKAEEKPAWGGVSNAPSTSALSLKEIQELEQREATRSRPEGMNQSMASRIAQAAGVAGGRLNLAASSSAPQASSPQNQPVQQPRASPTSTPPVAPASPVESSKPVGAHGGTLDEMSVDLRAMLGVSAPGGNKQKKSQKANTGAAAAAASKPAWGGTPPSSSGTSNRSLKEIQEEEARRVAAVQKQQALLLKQQQQQQKALQQQQQQQAQSRAPPGSWASTAAQPTNNNGDGWTISHKGRAVPTGTPQTSRVGKVKAKPSSAAPTAAAPAAATPVMQQQSHQQDDENDDFFESTPDNFGKEMSRDMRKWCEGQAPKIGATMTLIDFCYSLEDASDIRETLRDYLGSTPLVSSFASEFIARKGGKKGGDDFGPDAGFQTAGKKKNRRKKRET